MNKVDYTYCFSSSKRAKEIFPLLLDIHQWWYGLFDETITGTSEQLGDEFSFKAGGGLHTTTQKVVELLPGKKIRWQVTNSHLSFLSEPEEWKGTYISFELAEKGAVTEITFRHEGLVPEIECYSSCSSAWTGYLDRLKKKLN